MNPGAATHRTVVTLAGDPEAVVEAAVRAGKEAANLIANTKGWKMPKEMDKGELAAWFYIANILLNLDETITKD